MHLLHLLHGMLIVYVQNFVVLKKVAIFGMLLAGLGYIQIVEIKVKKTDFGSFLPWFFLCHLINSSSHFIFGGLKTLKSIGCKLRLLCGDSFNIMTSLFLAFWSSSKPIWEKWPTYIKTASFFQWIFLKKNFGTIVVKCFSFPPSRFLLPHKWYLWIRQHQVPSKSFIHFTFTYYQWRQFFAYSICCNQHSNIFFPRTASCTVTRKSF